MADAPLFPVTSGALSRCVVSRSIRPPLFRRGMGTVGVASEPHTEEGAPERAAAVLPHGFCDASLV